jgi:hypothetical protein
MAVEIAAELRRNQAGGRYDAYEAAPDLAGALTDDLRPHDRHFVVNWSQPGSGGEAPGSHSPEAQQEWREVSRLNNFGFESVTRLPGNIGYLDLRYFDDPAIAGDTALGAIAFLANTDAVIVDVRQNGGGEPGMVQLLMTPFFEGAVHFNSLYWRAGDRTDQFWTLPHLPVPRLPDVPLYVLTSARTGSAPSIVIVASIHSLSPVDR